MTYLAIGCVAPRGWKFPSQFDLGLTPQAIACRPSGARKRMAFSHD
jgi:hypothetical protein